MTRPLQPGDPAVLGPFAIDSRLADSPSGVVFLGSDDDGRRASIAALVGPASYDDGLKGRFRRAADPAALYDGEDGVRVLAADLDADTPWVATSYDGVRPGAERVIEDLSADDPTAQYFQPFTQYPAGGGYLPRVNDPRRTKRAWWWWVVLGILLLALILLLLAVLAQCGGGGQPSPSGSPTSGSSSGSPSSGSASPSSSGGSSSGSQSPSQSGTSGSPTRTRSGSPSTGGTGTGEPTGAPVDWRQVVGRP